MGAIQVANVINNELPNTPEAVLITDTNGTIGFIPEGLYRVITWSCSVDCFEFKPGTEPVGWGNLLDKWESRDDAFYFVADNAGDRWVLMVEDEGYTPLIPKPDADLLNSIGHCVNSIYEDWY